MVVNTFFLIPSWPLNNLGDAEEFVELLTFKKIFLHWILSGLIYRHLSINLVKD